MRLPASANFPIEPPVFVRPFVGYVTHPWYTWVNHTTCSCACVHVCKARHAGSWPVINPWPRGGSIIAIPYERGRKPCNDVIALVKMSIEWMTMGVIYGVYAGSLPQYDWPHMTLHGLGLHCIMLWDDAINRALPNGGGCVEGAREPMIWPYMAPWRWLYCIAPVCTVTYYTWI